MCDSKQYSQLSLMFKPSYFGSGNPIEFEGFSNSADLKWSGKHVLLYQSIKMPEFAFDKGVIIRSTGPSWFHTCSAWRWGDWKYRLVLRVPEVFMDIAMNHKLAVKNSNRMNYCIMEPSAPLISHALGVPYMFSGYERHVANEKCCTTVVMPSYTARIEEVKKRANVVDIIASIILVPKKMHKSQSIHAQSTRSAPEIDHLRAKSARSSNLKVKSTSLTKRSRSRKLPKSR